MHRDPGLDKDERIMGLLLLIRILLAFFIIRFVWNLLAKPQHQKKKPHSFTGTKKESRFESSGENIADADYEEVT